MNIFVIDAGHGKNDSGAVGVNGRKEKDDNLKTAKKVRDILEAAGAKVIMTREKDTYPTLAQRVKLANESGASAFVSLHRNAYNGSAQGIECLLSVHASEKSKILAENIQKRLVKTGGRNRGVKAQAKNVYVLDKTKMPATTVEPKELTEDWMITLDRENRLPWIPAGSPMRIISHSLSL